VAVSRITGVLQHLRRAAVLNDGAGLTDGQLLGCFVEHRDEAAFAALVRRHGPLVWGVCRRVLRGHEDAEDAFQATFLVLARKAAGIRSRGLLANWLYGVAYNTARKARALAARRMSRERQVKEMPEPAAAEQDLWDDLRPLLDQELSRLPDKYRAVVVLCDLGGKTRKEAARQLSVPEGTVAGRLARARTMLAKRLTRLGAVLSGGALAALLSQKAASASVPASVVSATIRAAGLLAAGQAAATGVISVKVAALTEGVLRAMLLTKLKTAVTVLLVLGIVAFGGVVLTHDGRGGPQARAAEPNDPVWLVGFVDSGTVDPATEKPPLPPAVRGDQGEKLSKIAAFYERTGHPETAAFYRQLAARTDEPKGGGTEKKKDDAKGASPLKGTWRVVSVTGGEGAFDVFKRMDLAFVGQRLIVMPTDPTDPGPAGVYQVHLGAKRPVQEIDFFQKADAGETRFLGVYDVKGDELRLCLSNRVGTRPGGLEPSKQQALIVARRVDLDGKSVDDGRGRGQEEPRKAAPLSHPSQDADREASDKESRRIRRWRIVFDTRDGTEYAGQLEALGARVAIPTEEPSQYRLICDLTKRPVRAITEDISKRKGTFLVESDTEAIKLLTKELGLKETPDHIVVFLPRFIEDELLRRELAFSHRPEKDIVETIFRFSRTDGGFDFKVTSQR
jgi:RNA polymerase sigma factor (sigma-70 family)